jgi:hypothetical protein
MRTACYRIGKARKIRQGADGAREGLGVHGFARAASGATDARRNAAAVPLISRLLRVVCGDDDEAGNAASGAMSVTNGLYSIQIEMRDGGHGHASGVLMLIDGTIAGGDSHFYYTGTYTADRGKWRGELTTNEHTKSVGVLPLFGGREVTCGFTGTYAGDGAEVEGTALVGKTSVSFHARLALQSAL